MDGVFLLVLAIVTTITVLPLVVILPSAPPLYDDAPKPAPLLFGGWRISITVARQQRGLESESTS